MKNEKKNWALEKKRKKKKEKEAGKKKKKKARVGSSPDRPWCDLVVHQQLANKKERKKEQDKYSSSSSFLPGKMQPVRDEHKPKFVQVSLLMSVVLLAPPPPSWAERDAVLCCSSSLLPAAATTAFFVFRAPAPVCLSVSPFDPGSFFFLTAICLLPYRVPFLCLGACIFMCVCVCVFFLALPATKARILCLDSL